MQEALTQHPLVVAGLQKSFGKHQVLRGVDLRLEAASIHGLVGLNGAGKTTALQCILGLLPFEAGQVSLLGLRPTDLHQSRGAVSVVFDEPCLHPHLTVRQTLRHAALLCGEGKDQLAELEELLGIARYRDFKLRDLSLGNRRRTSIAAALVGAPSLIVLDEPFNGLDAGGVEDVLTLIRRLNRERGITFLLASHQLSYLERICSHMAVLHQGKVVLSGSMEQLLSRKQNSVRLLTPQPEQAMAVLGASGARLQHSTTSSAQTELVCELDGMDSAVLNRILVSAGIDVYALCPERNSLESLFRDVTGGAAHES